MLGGLFNLIFFLTALIIRNLVSIRSNSSDNKEFICCSYGCHRCFHGTYANCSFRILQWIPTQRLVLIGSPTTSQPADLAWPAWKQISNDVRGCTPSPLTRIGSILHDISSTQILKPVCLAIDQPRSFMEGRSIFRHSLHASAETQESEIFLALLAMTEQDTYKKMWG